MDSNPGHQVSQAIALSTVPQPLTHLTIKLATLIKFIKCTFRILHQWDSPNARLGEIHQLKPALVNPTSHTYLPIYLPTYLLTYLHVFFQQQTCQLLTTSVMAQGDSNDRHSLALRQIRYAFSPLKLCVINPQINVHMAA